MNEFEYFFPLGRAIGYPSTVPSSLGCDEPECAFQCGFRNSLAPVVAVDEEACSPPVRRRDVHIAITPHPTRDLGKGSELTPSTDVGPLAAPGCLRPGRSHTLR